MHLAVFANDKRVKRKKKQGVLVRVSFPLVRLDFRSVKPGLNEKVCVVAPCILDTYLPLLTLCRGVCWALHPVGMCELPIDSRATICGMSQPRYGGSLGQRASKFW